MSSRKQRVEHALRDVLSQLIRTEVKDPRVRKAAFVSITNVDVNADFSVANVYCSIVMPPDARSPERDIEQVIEGLMRSGSYLRGPAARSLNLARPPELRFFHDQSAAMHERIAQLLREDKAKQGADVPGDDAPSHPKATD